MLTEEKYQEMLRVSFRITIEHAEVILELAQRVAEKSELGRHDVMWLPIKRLAKSAVEMQNLYNEIYNSKGGH